MDRLHCLENGRLERSIVFVSDLSIHAITLFLFKYILHRSNFGYWDVSSITCKDQGR